MLYTMHHGKIHRATVTQANLEYMGSISIDSELLELSGILPGERVQILTTTTVTVWTPMLSPVSVAAVLSA